MGAAQNVPQQPQPVWIGPQPQDTYRRALQLLQQDSYDDALAEFLQVEQLVPNFPFIQENIQQCYRMGLAARLYLEAVELLRARKWEEALKRLWYVENRLQRQFKNCNQMIDACRTTIWEESIQQQQQKMTQDQLNDQIRQFDKCYKQLLAVKKQGEEQRQNQHNIWNNNMDGQPQVENFQQQKIEKIPIYYQCQKEPRCNNPGPLLQFNHSVCNRPVYFQINGKISCESDCSAFFINDALFSCQFRTVTKKEPHLKENVDEQITTLNKLAQFIEDLLSSIQYTEWQKDEFRFKFSAEANQERMRRGMI